MGVGLRARGLVMLVVAGVCLAGAQAQGPAAPEAASKTVVTQTPLEPVSREAYLAQLETYRALLESCRSTPKACEPKQVGDDVRVTSAGRPAFDMRWDWLRETLAAAPDAKGGARDKLFRDADDRLKDETEAVSGGGPAAADVNQAAAKMQAILRDRQFKHVQQTSWLQEQILAAQLFLSSLFAGLTSVLPSSSWLGGLVQWGILGLAAIALGFWAWTTTRKQQMAISAERVPASLWQAESERWAERAEAEAARGDWREAVHCLYWAAIVMLEGQRLWRENRTRTPREYVRLLEAGSPRARLLGGLTGVFERIWYGLRAAERTDYEQARGLLEQLRAA